MEVPAIGKVVQIVTPIIQGVSKQIRSTAEGVIECLVVYKGPDGVEHERWFPVNEVKEVKEEPSAP